MSFQTLNGKAPLLHKLVYELRYPLGFIYLDRCGQTMSKIIAEAPEWTVHGSTTPPQGALLVNTKTKCVFSFSATKLSLGLEQPAGGDALPDEVIEVFGEQSDLLTSIVTDQLGLREFTRIGFRAWFLFSADSSEAAEEWLRSLGCVDVNAALVEAFGRRIDGVGTAIVIVAEDRKFRVAMNGVERYAQLDLGSSILQVDPRSSGRNQRERLRKELRETRRLRQNPGHAGLIDIDAYQEDPESVEPQEFISSSYAAFLTGLQALEAARKCDAD